MTRPPALWTLWYVHDPMCSWCWGFEPARRELLGRLQAGIAVRRLLGGLAPDSDAPMPPEMRLHLQQTWHRIMRKIPGTRFNFDFWKRCEPRRSTWPACRAVIAAREQAPEAERARADEAMTAAIQRAYYLEARNPSDEETLAALAVELGFDRERFLETLNAPRTQGRLEREMALGREMNATSFPSLVLAGEASRWPIPVDYRDAGAMLETIGRIVRPSNQEQPTSAA